MESSQVGRIGKHLKMDGKASGGKMQRGEFSATKRVCWGTGSKQGSCKKFALFPDLFGIGRTTVVDCLKIDERLGPFLSLFFERVGEI